MSVNVFQSCFDLIETYIYGGNIVSGSWNELVATMLSTAACLFVFALPFLLVWRMIKFWF